MKWIKAEDGLPEHPSIYVLIHTTSGLITSTLYCDISNFFDYECGEELFGETDEVSSHFHHARRFGYKVTHWMPLPEPPKEVMG